MRVDMNVRWINKLSMYKKERVFVMLKLKRLAAMCCAAMLTLGASALAETQVNVTALKGPTAMGMVKLMDEAESGAVEGNAYSFAIAAAVDEVTPKIVKGETDIAAVPANLASVLYQNTKGEVQVLAVNTLGVIYIVESGDSVKSVEDLRGRTIYASGKGATPEYALNYILSENGIDPTKDVTIEWKSEHAECLAALLAEDNAIAMLPQPFVTTAQMKSDRIQVRLDLTAEWDAVEAFLKSYAESVEYVNANVEEAAQLVGKYEIVPAAVAQKAIPACNIVCITGADMQQKLSGYLNVLFEQNPKAVGGALPADDFYYNAK